MVQIHHELMTVLDGVMMMWMAVRLFSLVTLMLMLMVFVVNMQKFMMKRCMGMQQRGAGLPAPDIQGAQRRQSCHHSHNDKGNRQAGARTHPTCQRIGYQPAGMRQSELCGVIGRSISRV